ncbi:MAG: polymer-forming cytoskeletal protein [Planctomycetes bacterium]|nr:polymer-forming cytoskeletal protein [Planctomycetota bacterium]
MADTRDNTTTIGPGARFKGELTLEGPAQILGCIEGSIESNGQVTIGNGANCNATVEAGTIIVDGSVQGDLIAKERLQLTGKANVQGDISAAALVVAEGATFVGHVAVGPEAVAAAQSKRTSAPKAVEYKAATKRSASGDWLNENESSKDWATRAADAA